MMENEYRNHTCGELNIKNVGEEVRLAGWVQRIRNLGAMTFIDLRDEFGITQLVFKDSNMIPDEIITNQTKNYNRILQNPHRDKSFLR